jgi:pimeloyl-ACP methyl ester carboxylesterase
VATVIRAASIIMLSVLWSLPTFADSRYINVDGVRIHFIDKGRGEPVLLIHGYTGSIESWRQRGVIDRLLVAGYRVVAYDNRGHGLSGKPHDSEAYGLQMIEDARRLLDHLNISRAHVVGYSMGGRLANKFREMYPSRFLTVTLGGFGWPHTPRPQQSVEQIQKMLDSRGLSNDMDAAALAAYRKRYHDTDGTEASLRNNEVPALILIGEDDRGNLPLAHSLAETMAKSELRVVPGDHPAAHGTEEFMSFLLAFLNRYGSVAE